MFDKYFSDSSSKRAFAGLGVGTFSGATVTDANNVEVDGANSLGLIPRIGFELGHIRLIGEYNYIFKKEVPDYIGIHLVITLWGGYKG